MVVDDPVLPAAAHLTGRGSRHVLGAALAAVGGTLEASRPSHLHYRPGHSVVVRFDGCVRWAEGSTRETLVAATTAKGPPAGTLPVEAVTDDGDTLAVGVWRWPFDPELPGLADAVTPSSAASFLDGAIRGRPRLEVLVYRPTQRAVVRATGDDGDAVYLKVVGPTDVARLVRRHEHLLAAGVPVPAVLGHDTARGLIAFQALTGATIRDRLKRGGRRLPGAEQYETLYARLAGVELPHTRGVESRASTALRHADMLARVVPDEHDRIAALVERLAPAATRAAARYGPTIHGDLYEAQLVTGRGPAGAARITGVLDLDDAGPGDPLDDRATVIAHLVDRALDRDRKVAPTIRNYVQSLRTAFANAVDPAELDLVTAGVLVGLATGPFRVQQPRWRQAVHRRLAVADRLAANPGQASLGCVR